MTRFKVGDRVIVLSGNYRSGNVGGVIDFENDDPVVKLDGFPEPESFEIFELRLEKYLSSTKHRSS